MLNTLGIKILEARKALNLSQSQLASQLFISPQAVGKWERGESLPDLAMLFRLAEILHMDLNQLSENFHAKQESESPASNPVKEQLPAAEKPSSKAFRDMSAGNWYEADFAGTELNGISFASSDLRKACFDRSLIHECKFSTLNLSDATFKESKIAHSQFDKSDLTRTTFDQSSFSSVKFHMLDLRKTSLLACTFSDVEFAMCDLSGMNFEGLEFTDVLFTNSTLKDANFKNAVLNRVRFEAPHAITNRFFRSLKTVSFHGAKMDKLSYASLMRYGLNLEDVIRF